MSGKSFALLCVTLVLLVGLSSQVPVHDQTKNLESTTVKILIPPKPSAQDSDDDDAVVVEASNDDKETESDEAREFDPNDCFLEKSKGPCRAVIDSWFFNAATKSCESFAWSGCGGNNNRFSEKKHCETRCMNKPASTDHETAASEPTASNIKVPANATKSQCPEFDGCGPLKCAVVEEPDTGCKKCACAVSDDDDRHMGSASKSASGNVPESVQVSSGGIVVGKPKLPVGSVSGTPSKLGEEDSSEINSSEKPEDVCQLPATRGHCRAMMTRWRYDPKIKDCVEFHFGGCDGNSNNFVNKDKCVKYCKGQ